jgi:PAS domain S-box-containing protein
MKESKTVKKYAYKQAKQIIDSIHQPAMAGEFDTREEFISMLRKNPHVAVQGYNAFGKIFLWNHAAVHAYGYTEAEAINQDLIELILPPDLRGLARDMISSARETGKMPEPGPCDLVRKGGEFVAVYSGHLVFQWKDTNSPEYYCIDLLLADDED